MLTTNSIFQLSYDRFLTVCDPFFVLSGGRFLGALSSINTWAGRTAALTALQASYNSNSNNTHNNINSSRSSDRVGASAAVKGQLGSSRLLDVLEGWMNEAVKDKQITFIVQALKVCSLHDEGVGISICRCFWHHQCTSLTVTITGFHV